MPRATCRCGQPLTVSTDGTERIVCPKCGSRVRLRRKPGTAAADGLIRFFCPCGRRLKVRADRPSTHGKCPDCGRVVPISAVSTASSENAETVDLCPEDLAALDAWTRAHAARAADPDDISTPPISAPPSRAPLAPRAEVGLRVCPRCKKPVHLGSDVCSTCGIPVPRR